MNDATAAVRRRAVLLWLAVTAGAAGLVLVAGPAAGPLRPGASFTDLLVGACGLAAAVAATLLWLTTTDVVWHQLRTPGATDRTRRPTGPVRTLLLAACGVVAVAGPAAAAGGDGPAPALDGLPLPDRATGTSGHADPVDRADPADRPGTVQVRPGDSLWAIAERALGPGASVADIASYWQRMQALNAGTVGADPDLLHPGQQLRLPPPTSS